MKMGGWNPWAKGIWLGDSWIPAHRECEHFLICGTVGSGKSTLIRQLLEQIRERNEPAIVIDPHSEFAHLFFEPARGDVMLNPVDANCPFWTPWSEIRPEFAWQDAEGVTAALFRRGDEWQAMGRIVLNELLRSILDHDSPRNIARFLTQDAAKIQATIGKTLAAKFISNDGKALSMGVLASVAEVIAPFSWLPEKGETAMRWSTRQWASDPKGWIFLSSLEEGRAATHALQAMWLDLLAQRLLSRDQASRIWLIADELPVLGYQPRIPQVLSEGRKRGIAGVIGFQTVGQLRRVYSRDGAIELTDVPGTRIMLRCGGHETAEWEGQQLGKYDGEPLVTGTDIQLLPPFWGFINVVGYLPAWLHIPRPQKRAPSYPVSMLRQPKWELNMGEKQIFANAKRRCEDLNDPDYGGRGIKFLFATVEEMVKALGGPRPAINFTMDRINNDGPYGPDNVRWADKETQAANKRGKVPAQPRTHDKHACKVAAGTTSGISPDLSDGLGEAGE